MCFTQEVTPEPGSSWKKVNGLLSGMTFKVKTVSAFFVSVTACNPLWLISRHNDRLCLRPSAKISFWSEVSDPLRVSECCISTVNCHVHNKMKWFTWIWRGFYIPGRGRCTSLTEVVSCDSLENHCSVKVHVAWFNRPLQTSFSKKLGKFLKCINFFTFRKV